MPNRFAFHKRIAIEREDGAFDVPIGRGLFAVIDKEDIDPVTNHTWCGRREPNGKVYVWTSSKTNGVRKDISLGQFLLSPPSGMQVDHIDRNPLNNRRGNLRVATGRQNAANRNTVTGKSGFIGVSIAGNAFLASIRVGEKTIRRRFKSAQQAARFRDEIVKFQHGEFAVLNFPE